MLGQTPLRSVALTPGSYTIWFRTRPPLSFEPEPLPERTFTVVAGDTVLIQEHMGSLVRIETTPANAKVTIGGRPAGRTPLEFRWQPLRSGDVRLHLDGYRPRRVPDPTLERGGDVHVRLTPLPERALPAASPSLERSVSRFNWPAWGSLYGLVSCVAIIVVSKLIGKAWLMRSEAYYDD